jgi:outer membrane protein insertion porin family
MDPTRGGASSFSVEYAGLGGSERFAKFELSHRQFFPLFWHTVLSLNGDIGYVTKTSSDEIPLSEKFFLGGLRTIRGFKTREVGPTEEGAFIGGEKAAYFNLEYLFPISPEYKLKGVLFVDSGNAWKEDEAYFSDMRYGAGYGIRWLSPLGPLRFEWGYNLDPRGTERSSVFEFSIGTFF